MPTKLTPFTTRPPSTSRQGTTRTASTSGPRGRRRRRARGEGVGDAEATLVQRPADDRAGQPAVAHDEAGQRPQVVEGAYAAAGHDVDRGRREHGRELVEVGAGHGAVPADLGDDERHAEAVE